METDSVIFPCFLQCVAIEQEGSLLVERLAVKGEIMHELAGSPLPEIFVSEPEVLSHHCGMELVASFPLPGLGWQSHDRGYTDLLEEEHAGRTTSEKSFALEIVNRSEHENEIVVMASGEARGKIRLFFVHVKPGMMSRIGLDPLGAYDDLHLISWQAFDAFMVAEGPDLQQERVPIPVRIPGKLTHAGERYASYCQERYTHQRFSGSYLFGYFEKVTRGMNAGSLCLHVFWPNHGQLMHVRYLCKTEASRRNEGPLISTEILADRIRRQTAHLTEPDEMTVLLVSDLGRRALGTKEYIVLGDPL